MIVEARIRHTGAITAKCLFSIITQLNILPQAQKSAALLTSNIYASRASLNKAKWAFLSAILHRRRKPE